MSAKQAENRQCKPSQCYSVTSSYRLNSSLQPGAVGTSRSNETFYVPEAEIIVEALDAEGPVGDPGYGSNSDGASTSLDSSALNFIHENGRVIRASLTVFASFPGQSCLTSTIKACPPPSFSSFFSPFSLCSLPLPPARTIRSYWVLFTPSEAFSFSRPSRYSVTLLYLVRDSLSLLHRPRCPVSVQSVPSSSHAP